MPNPEAPSPEDSLQNPPDSPRLSIVVPLHNEEDNVDELHRRLVESLSHLSFDHEFLFVDDGSTDETAARAAALATHDPRLTLLQQSPCSGKASAVDHGITKARGQLIVLLDGDLQFPPEEIPQVLEALDDGADVVGGRRTGRQDPFLRLLGSRLHNELINAIAGVRFQDHFTGMLGLRRTAIETMALRPPLNRFPLVVASRRGLQVREVPIRHAAREAGQSAYTLLSLIALALRDLKALLLFLKSPEANDSDPAS